MIPLYSVGRGSRGTRGRLSGHQEILAFRNENPLRRSWQIPERLLQQFQGILHDRWWSETRRGRILLAHRWARHSDLKSRVWSLYIWQMHFRSRSLTGIAIYVWCMRLSRRHGISWNSFRLLREECVAPIRFEKPHSVTQYIKIPFKGLSPGLHIVETSKAMCYWRLERNLTRN